MTLYKIHSLLLAVVHSVFLTNRLKINSLIIVIMTSLPSLTSAAGEVNSGDMDQYLLNSCNAFKTDTNNKALPCILYIKGFFNGLLNAGNSNISNIDEKNKKPSTLIERAYANRVGKIAERKPLSHSCITVDELKVLIIESLSDDSASTFLSVKQFNSFMIKTLTTACSSDKKSK